MNLLGILVSVVFIFFIIGLSSFLTKKKILTGESSRKFIHIGVSNWWIIAMIFYDNFIYASIVPALFIIINYASYKKNIFKSMERGKGKEDLGTVYYAISLFILAIITFNFTTPYIGAMGILVMGYGDGFAALVGEKYGKMKVLFNKNKSLVGTFTMFFVSFFVAVLVSYFAGDSRIFINALIIALVSALIELISPYGTDNLTVPLSASFIYYLMTLY